MTLRSEKFIAAWFSTQQETATKVLIEDGLGLAKSLFSRFHQAQTHISSGLASSVPAFKSGKLYGYVSKQEALARANQEGSVLHFTIYSLPARESAAAFDWTMIVECGRYPDLGLDLFQIGIDISIFPFQEAEYCIKMFLDLFSEVQHLLRGASYGFASVMPSQYMPLGYATGLMGAAPSELIYDANAWRKGYGNDLTRVRSIHGINLVNRNMLSQLVGSVTLGEWIIDGDGERGRLTKLTDELYLWLFSDKGTCLNAIDWNNGIAAAVRRQLQEKQVFPWSDWIERQ